MPFSLISRAPTRLLQVRFSHYGNTTFFATEDASLVNKKIEEAGQLIIAWLTAVLIPFSLIVYPTCHVDERVIQTKL